MNHRVDRLASSDREPRVREKVARPRYPIHERRAGPSSAWCASPGPRRIRVSHGGRHALKKAAPGRYIAPTEPDAAT